MATWYEVQKRYCYGERIKAVEVVRQSRQSVWVLDRSGKERRRAIETEYDHLFPAYAEARAYAVLRQERAVEGARERLAAAEAELAIAVALPESAP